MTRFLKAMLCLIALLFTAVIASFHAGVMKKPEGVLYESNARAEWIDKSRFGMNQLVLEGTAFTRGQNAGRLTKELLFRQEKELNDQLANWVPSRLLLQGLVVIGINYFRGIDEFIPHWASDEMYGVSLSAPHDYDFLADGFTRQVAYHGLHEVGQMMVDQGGDTMGCTVVAVPVQGSWVIGRNFDFEGGSVFDTEKIVKWVFPDSGNPYVSVIWAGMVGAVSGVNSNGLYISINAAGSTDFRRIGMPSTLVLLKALQFSNDIEEALEILKNETMFITDIFAVVDSKSGRAFRVEKSPLRTNVTELKTSFVIANHLLSDEFKTDRVNVWRRDELTSSYRFARGEKLLSELKPEQSGSAQNTERLILQILRDKGEVNGRPLHLNNRRAIDALIATHSVVYNAKEHVLLVSQGPGVSGEFTGFDLKRSFHEKRPVEIRRLPPDIAVSRTSYWELRSTEKAAGRARSLIRKNQCGLAKEQIQQFASVGKETSLAQMAYGDFQANCENDLLGARQAWEKALALHPAYPREEKEIKEKLAE